MNREHERVGAVRSVSYVLPCPFRFDRGVGQDQEERRLSDSSMLLSHSGLLSLCSRELDNSYMKMHKNEMRKACGALLERFVRHVASYRVDSYRTEHN